MLASAGRPSLHGYDACMVYWTNGALRRICRLFGFFCSVEILG